MNEREKRLQGLCWWQLCFKRKEGLLDKRALVELGSRAVQGRYRATQKEKDYETVVSVLLAKLEN